MNETIMHSKVLLLCNNRIAFPALRELLFFGQVAAVVVPAKNKDLLADLDGLLKDTGVPLLAVERNNFQTIIREAIEKNKVMAALIMTFPYLIPKELFSLPAKGFINFHYGRLPEYRGPQPIFMQLLVQEKKPALTVHVVTEGIDDGPVILTEAVAYDPDDTYGIFQRKMANAGEKAVRLLLKILNFGNFLPSVPQDESRAAYHKKPVAADLTINWQAMDSHAIKALVNACNPWNKGCGAVINDRVIGITEVEILNDNIPETYLPGTIINLDPEKGMLVCTLDNKILRINILYTEEGFFTGKRMLDKGFKKGDRFS